MAIGIYFSPKSMNESQYKDIMKRLEAAGAASPKGQKFHSCFGTGDHLMVFDIWESQAAFDSFGATLMPILAQVGVDPGEPQVMPMVSPVA